MNLPPLEGTAERLVDHAPQKMLPGMTLDKQAYDLALKAKTPPLSTRLGPEETKLLTKLAAEFNLTRSNLARRLLVEGLLELRGRHRA